MRKFKTHYCLVSQQAAPNLLPLLDDDMKPEKVVLLVTPQMQKQADYLKEVIRPRGITVEKQDIHHDDRFEAMHEQLMDIIGNESSADIALNATGGTKWMAIAAQQTFHTNESAVFYVDVQNDRVLFLGGEPSSHTLSQSINLRNYIHAYGYEFREGSQPSGLPSQRRDLCQQLVHKVKEWQNAIGQLNLIASEAERRGSLQVNLGNTVKHPDAHLLALLAECTAAGILKDKVTIDSDIVIFSDDTARSLANGGWLEDYVNSRLNELKGDNIIQDSPHRNLHIQRIGATSHNEIDVCFMARNRLHLIECKTKRMAGKGTGDTTTDTVYKLDSISELGGLATKSMLVSYRGLSTADQQRAKDLGIKVIQGEQIQRLKNSLRDWIGR